MNSSSDILERLWANPVQFRQNGEAYQLLQAYFSGLPLDTLQEMLKKTVDIDVVRVGVWIASELGRSASPLVEDVLPLLDLNDCYVSYHVIEILAACSTVCSQPLALCIAEMMTSHDEVLSRRAAVLLSRIPDDKLQDASLRTTSQKHRAGMTCLLGAKEIDINALVMKASNPDPLERRYAAAALKRRGIGTPKLLQSFKGKLPEEVWAIMEG